MVFRPQVKLMKEQKYGVEPNFDIDSVRLYVLDPNEFNYNENQNIQYSETISQEDITDAAPGNFDVTGNTTFPMRVTQMPFINYMCLGKAYLTLINVDTDGDGNSDKTYGAQVVCTPSIDKMPSFTMWVNAVKPKRFVTINGAVFNNFRISVNSGSIINTSVDFAARFSDTVFADDVPNRDLEAYVGNKASTIPLNPTDVAASQDAAIYGDMEVCDYDAVTNVLTLENGSTVTPDNLPEGYDIIDVIYEKQDTGTGTVPTKIIIGKFMFDVKSADLTLSIPTFTTDAHRIGDRLAQEYPMRTVQRRDFKCDLTVDFTGSSEDLYKKFIAYMTTDNHVHPNQVDFGSMSLVMKIGHPTNLINKTADKKDINIKSYLFGNDISKHTDPLGSFERTTYIIPNIVLETVGQISAKPGTKPELRVTTKFLNDKNRFFKDVVFETPQGDLKINNEKLLALSFKKFDTGTNFEVDYDSSTGESAVFLDLN